ncbi:cupredoxin domain-containing protein [Actinospongicola halichondriae]|uniref:cupredoxin domain-containing protein n=1 Tax=Actinospongicola halichondriae TaxID=3236844 RepID=UPI003D550868
MTTVDERRTEGAITGPPSAWRSAASISAVVASFGLLSLLVTTGEIIPPAIVLGLLFLGTAVALRRTTGRWPLYAGMALPVITIAGNAPFIVEDMSHPDSAAGFVPSVVILGGVLLTLVASVLAKRESSSTPRPLALATLGVASVAIVASLVSSASLSDDERQEGDVSVVASGAEYPDEIRATAGEVGLFVENDDAIRHTFLIEGTSVDQEVPGATDRRVTVDLEPGTYRYYCDVVGHDGMEGTLVVE